MNKLGLVTGVVGLSVLITACGHSTKASEGNFAKAIDEYAAQEQICLPMNLPVQTESQSQNIVLGSPEIHIARKNGQGDNINKEALKQMRILVDAGLYTADKNDLQVNDGDKNIPVSVFRRAENNDGAFALNNTSMPLLCLGHQKVDKIILFTEPTSEEGMIVSNVVYAAKLVPTKWAEKLLKDREEDGKAILHNTQRKSATLVLTNQGWKDKREFK